MAGAMKEVADSIELARRYCNEIKSNVFVSEEDHVARKGTERRHL